MPKVQYVTRVYRVEIPDDRDMVRRHILEDGNGSEDTDVIMSADSAIAVWLSVQADVGNYTSAVDVIDIDVTDELPPGYEHLDERSV